MTEHFTSPEFSDALAGFGIVKETPFYLLLMFTNTYAPEQEDSFDYIVAVKSYKGFIDINTGLAIWDYLDIKPAYLLTEVLKWLPRSPNIKGMVYTYMVATVNHDYKTTLYGYRDGGSNVYGMFTIEQLITQGLTEGWLTKEIIEQAIKDNV